MQCGALPSQMNHYAEVAQGLQAAGVGGEHNGTTQTLISFDVIFDRCRVMVMDLLTQGVGKKQLDASSNACPYKY